MAYAPRKRLLPDRSSLQQLDIDINGGDGGGTQRGGTQSQSQGLGLGLGLIARTDGASAYHHYSSNAGTASSHNPGMNHSPFFDT